MSGAAGKVAMSGPLRAFGKKQVEQASQWVTSATTFGLTAGTGLLYFTDWRLFVNYIPFYNTKFSQEPES
ncbi:hypothetical protein CBL_11582 [Carabus blaptoides fortunei]